MDSYWKWFVLFQVGKPKVGENRPSRVRADVTIHLAVKDPVRVEWESQLANCCHSVPLFMHVVLV